MTTANPSSSSQTLEPSLSTRAVFADYTSENISRWQSLIGQSVLHFTYGYGIIISVNDIGNDPSVVVKFDDRPTGHESKVPLNSPTRFQLKVLTDEEVFLEVCFPPELSKELEQRKASMIWCARIAWCRSQLDSHLETLNKVAQEMIASMRAEILETPHLDIDDIHLALRWDDFPEPELANLSDREALFALMTTDAFAQHPKLARVLSARAAEKAVIQFYRSHGHDVIDKSITQLGALSSGEWRDYDLLVDGSPIDVKNARRIIKQRGRWTGRRIDTYVEHCVPRYKKAKYGEDVAIAGVLSSRLQTRTLIDPACAPPAVPTDVTYLGTTTLGTLNVLQGG